MQTTQLRVTHEFNAGGVAYSVRDIVSPDAPDAWGEGALERRIEHGFIKHEQIVVPSDEQAPVLTLVELLQGKSKTELQAYALALTPPLEINKDKMNLATMLTEIQHHIASQPDAE